MNSLDLNILQDMSNIHHSIESDVRNYIDKFFNIENNEKLLLSDIKKYIHLKIKNYTKEYLEQYEETFKYNENTYTIWNGRHQRYGLAFPICLSLNNIIAHYTPSNNNKNVFFTKNDILKIDYGLHYNGNMCDSAFSITYNPELQELVNISKEATNIAIKECGIEANVFDIGSTIQEYIESNELILDNKTMPLKSFSDMCGHKINLYKIHDNIPFPNIKLNNNSNTYRMRENDYFAIEPYPTTGNGTSLIHNQDLINNSAIKNDYKQYYIYSFNYNDTTYYNLKKYLGPKNYKNLPKSILKTFDKIQKQFYYLPFEYDDLINDTQKCFNNILELTPKVFNKYEAVFDTSNSYSAQTEKNIYINNEKTIIL
tara:strand:+ start:35 stop:1144 length:1110 start_codon:yes stop_codon:yes gene_type:complete